MAFINVEEQYLYFMKVEVTKLTYPYTSGETRTRNPAGTLPVPYPLGHRGLLEALE
jgi:hypothetical protein